MTIQECIKQLESLRAHCDAMCDDKLDSMDCWDKDVQALDMALEILKFPDVCQMQLLAEDEVKFLFGAVKNAPVTLMSAEPVIRWISVEDRLPEDSDGWVLMTDGKDWYKAPRAWMFRLSGEPGYWIPARHGAGAKITHWMPLPPLPEPPEAAK